MRWRRRNTNIERKIENREGNACSNKLHDNISKNYLKTFQSMCQVNQDTFEKFNKIMLKSYFSLLLFLSHLPSLTTKSIKDLHVSTCLQKKKKSKSSPNHTFLQCLLHVFSYLLLFCHFMVF
jgi:hypothetical protein